MKKYLQLIKLTFEEYLVYRLNFVLWRFRSFVFFLSLFFFWLAIYGEQNNLFGYQKAQMVTYLVVVAFLRSLILATRTADLAGQIRSGELTGVLLWPLRMSKYWFGRDLVDKALNIFFTFLEIGLILLLFRFPFYFPQNPATYFYFAFLVLIAVLLFFFYSFFLSITGFWTHDIWATRWLFGVIFLNFFAGAIFPLEVLPFWLKKIINFLPFPYLIYFPAKIWLEQLSGQEIFLSFLVCSAWLGFFYWLARYFWKKGVKNYGAFGG